MRAFPVSLPSGQRYWSVLDEDLQVVGVADEYLRHLRFGRDAAGVHDQGVCAFDRVVPALVRPVGPVLAGRCRKFALFMTWLAHAGHRSMTSRAWWWPVRAPQRCGVRRGSTVC